MTQPPDQPLNLVLVGPPGSGKSTIAEALVHAYTLVSISTGQRLRAEIQARSAIGREVVPYLDRGNLAPDSLMDRLMRGTLERLEPSQGFLLDGYPRTLRQARGLVGMLADFKRELHAVLALGVNDEEVVRRLSGRRICEGAGEPFPVHIDDLSSVMRCQERGGRLVERDDDRPEVVRQRLAVYHEQTQPLLEFYSAAGLLRRIDAQGTPAEVARRALAALGQLRPA
ncbi:MAG TPA: nucleoside monophosphate kinase [Kouleothrix sp.]|uniref:adenylate kinase family protein n=1 Tax=Kouleothrix sp. TaxID=2779161 RepID=UPI002D05712C|nr:nucleoside monophosphate kinase [Kouleothrix sp.]HRC74086.1 nucleoside monophosphate kinase [Kouleothrix sp.]